MQYSKNDTEVFFHIPVTKGWLQQAVLSLTLTCHSSYSGVIEFFHDIFDQHICKGTIFNITHKALQNAGLINDAMNLSAIKVGAHDEIFQGNAPVLVGCDVKSTYVYLLKQEEHRDATTWGVRLLELSDRGMMLDHTIADGGNGLRSGQREAWPDIPCWGDVFHPIYDLGKLVVFLKNRAVAAIEAVEKLERKMAKAKKKNQGTKHSRHLGHAREEMTAAMQLRDDICTLKDWLQNDILSVTGPDFATRYELLDFVIGELLIREPSSPHRIRPIRRLLEIQGGDLLRFVQYLDMDLQALADAYNVDLYLVRQVFELQGIPVSNNCHWERSAELYRKIGANFYNLQEAIKEIVQKTVRASSLVENLNSRLRNYFFLRKTLGNGYLGLLQFFLNHRRFLRSSRPERIGKSPKELLTGKPHDHWLELLGYSMFKKSGTVEESNAEARKIA